MKNELRIFFTALMFYTRIPVPKWVGYSSVNLNKSTRYFPFIGIIVGGIGAGVFYLCHMLLPLHVSIILGLSAMILLTGAFHEDAFSDFCDGFGGGYGKEKILSIMKDSRIGTYGATGLVLLLLLKFFLITSIDVVHIPIVFIAAHAFSRLNPVLLIFTAPYVRLDDSSKTKPVGEKHSVLTLIIAIIFGVAPLFLLHAMIVPAIIVFNTLVFFYFRNYVKKKIGGYTGDVLGALQQLSELGVYLTILVSNVLML